MLIITERKYDMHMNYEVDNTMCRYMVLIQLYSSGVHILFAQLF
jgi:hypothetical protein